MKKDCPKKTWWWSTECISFNGVDYNQVSKNDLSFEIVNKINKIVLVLKAEIFIISFQTNLHAFFSPFLSCPYYCLCITFKSDIYKYVQLRIKTARLSVLSVLWLCYPWKQKKVCCVWNQCLFFGEMYKLYLQHI